MKKFKYGLTGKGFTLEEADEILRDHQPQVPKSKEEREKYLAALKQGVARFKAEMAIDGECDGVPVTREDLERAMAEQRAETQAAASCNGETNGVADTNSGPEQQVDRPALHEEEAAK